MVFNKLKFIRIFIIFLFVGIFLYLLSLQKSPVETSLAKALLPEEAIKNTKILSVIEHSASAIKVIFESEDEDELKDLKQNFLENIDTGNFVITSPDFSELLDLYAKEPANFLSSKTKQLIKEENYDAVYQQGMERLYNPIGISVASFENDPFLLLTDFLSSNDTIQKNNNIDGKYYDTEILQLKSDSDNSKENIKNLIKLKNKYSKNKNHIYLAGTPIHTYYTTLSSTITINIICVLITFLIIFLTYFYFKTFKLLLPIALSIAFGFLAGFSVTKSLFANFHLITFLFGTTLIGIGVDYSYHYIFKENFDKKFVKNLTLSLISTISAFALLYLIQTDILNQIATFTIAGLSAIYLFIMILYPIIDFPPPEKTYNPEFSPKFKIGLIIFITLIMIFGLLRIKFNDDLTALYTPNKILQKSEILFSKISNQIGEKNYVIAVKGENLQSVLENEEAVTSELDKNSTNYICISKFVPSPKQQKENAKLVKNLYNSQLNKYLEILSAKQIESLKQSKTSPILIDINKFSFFKNLMPDGKTSLVICFSDKEPINHDNAEIISIQSTLSHYLHKHRLSLQKLLPIIYILLYLILLISYGWKKSFRMFLPILLSQIFAISFLSLIGIKLNMFSVLGLILSLGFTIDYAVFSENRSEKTSAAIFLACITTALSFLLLVFTTFKLISMLSLVISICILSSYLLTKIFIQEK